jgi:histidyl-tRNA synthetase
MQKSAIKKQKAKKKESDFYAKMRDKSEEVALYYGFMPIESLEITKDDREKAKAVVEGQVKVKNPECTLSVCPEEKIAVLRHFDQKNLHSQPQPVMLFYKGDPSGSTKSKEKHIGLEIIGTSKSIAEAILIKATMEILKEEGYKDLYVTVNSIGDKDSIAKFIRNLTAYYRKNINELPSHCRTLMKRDIFECLDCKNEKCRIFKEDAPKSINFLSEPSRQHFKEVLEYLEMLEIPYQMNNYLVGNKSFCTQTLFEVRTSDGGDEGQPLAIGVRYNNLAKKIGWKRETPGIGVRIAYKKTVKEVKVDKSMKKPKIYFVQLGFEAKLKSLKVIEMLRQSKIPMYQSLSRDKLISQLSLAENMKIPYTILMGQKEALENSVIVREMTTRSQETVLVANLPQYLKRIK